MCVYCHYPQVLEDLQRHKFPVNFKKLLPDEAELVEWLTAPTADKRPSAAEVQQSKRLQSLSSAASRDSVIPKL